MTAATSRRGVIGRWPPAACRVGAADPGAVELAATIVIVRVCEQQDAPLD